MKRNELIQLRELVDDEIKRRKRIKELLRNELVMEYLEITKTNPIDLDIDNIAEILSKVLSSFTFTKTNGIYVCTNALYTDYRICYEDIEYYSQHVAIDSEYADYKTYRDIESGESIEAQKEENEYFIRPLISSFEKENIVLNPHNTCNNQNGYGHVRFDFFNCALKEGQEKAKKLVLSKYPRI